MDHEVVASSTSLLFKWVGVGEGSVILKFIPRKLYLYACPMQKLILD
ncbi:hypothetical protein QFZ31_000294 [Neobacillus niacini]|nr:hypothetical protein [Neobacillus niacini]